MSKINDCPRCKAPWTLEKDERVRLGKQTTLKVFCPKCTLLYVCDDNGGHAQIHWSVIVKGKRKSMLWDLDSCRTVLITNNNDGTWKEDNLGWLPFDITPERINLLVVFL